MTDDLWVFAYGSLMWRPGFSFQTAVRASLTGYSRGLCIYSVHHRGSPARPGLVLGLDRGGVCHGMAFRVAASHSRTTLAYLRAREQVNGVYREALVPVSIDGGGSVHAIAYLAERAHPSYSGRLALSDQARIVRAARGLSGENLDYLASTISHLEGIGIRERELERVLALCAPLFGRGDDDAARRARIAGLVRASQMDSIVAPLMKPGARRRFIHRQREKTGRTVSGDRERAAQVGLDQLALAVAAGEKMDVDLVGAELS